jgi:hypothetical protein
MPPEGDGAGAGGQGGGDGANGAPGDGANEPSEGDKLLAQFKEAGLETPAKALELIKELRGYEKGDKLPGKVKAEMARLEKQVKDAEDAKLTDTQRLQQRIDDLEAKGELAEQRAVALVRNAAIVDAARKVGAIDPDAMPRLIDTDAIEVDDAGSPTNVAALLEKLAKDKPQWFRDGGPGSFDGGARGGRADGKPDMNAMLREKAGRT